MSVKQPLVSISVIALVPKCILNTCDCPVVNCGFITKQNRPLNLYIPVW